MSTVIGLLARAVMWGMFIIIVGDAVVTLWDRGDEVLAVLAVIFFPATIFIWPWTHEAFGYPLWIAFLIAAIAYPISTFVGGLPSIDRPGHF